jgi:Na+-driven multidrug efflux pump
VRLEDLQRVPSLSEVAPLIAQGITLSLRTFASLLSVFSATSLVAQLGAIPLAAHEILRQCYLFSIVSFDIFSIAAQALVARCLGRGAFEEARGVSSRLFQLATGAGIFVGASLWLLRDQVALAFTKEAAVSSAVLSCFPILVAFLPLDALVMSVDGVLLASQQMAFVARSMIVASALCLIALHASQAHAPGLISIWLSLKLLTIGRLIMGSRKLASRESPLAGKPVSD